MKYKYRTNQIAGNPDKNKFVCLDATLLLHDEDEQNGLLRLQNQGQKNNYRFYREIDKETIKYFIYTHIESGTHIVSDRWLIYQFLDY